MDLFKLFNQRKSPGDLKQEEFEIALAIIAKYAGELEGPEMIEQLVIAGLNEKLAVELYLFMPTAFCRQFIPEANYKDTYVEYYGPHKQIEKNFKDNKLYIAIEQATKNYFHESPQREVILNVAGISAEFKVINKALLRGSLIENLEFSSPYIIR